MSKTSLLNIQSLSVSYESITAIKNLSLDVYENEIVALIGANGAGKTTTLKSISGLLPYKGTIKFNGQDLSGFEVHEIVKMGLCHAPEGRGIFAPLTVEENLEMGSFMRKDKNRTHDLNHCFELFPRLKERLKQQAGTLSGGEQQMLAISRALMSKPKLLMLDEPSLGLAPQIVNQIFSIIKKINSEGVTVLLVEQNARMALKISDRAYVIETGEMKLSGSGRELLLNDEVKQAYLGG